MTSRLSGAQDRRRIGSCCRCLRPHRATGEAGNGPWPSHREPDPGPEHFEEEEHALSVRIL